MLVSALRRTVDSKYLTQQDRPYCPASTDDFYLVIVEKIKLFVRAWTLYQRITSKTDCQCQGQGPVTGCTNRRVICSSAGVAAE